MNWRTKSETRLEKMGEFITIHPKKIIVIMLILSIAIISNLRFITIDTSTEGFLKADDPALIRYDAFKEQFGQDEKIMVIIESKDIFSMESLKKLKKLHAALAENVPHLNDITSLINARNTRGESGRATGSRRASRLRLPRWSSVLPAPWESGWHVRSHPFSLRGGAGCGPCSTSSCLPGRSSRA